MAKRVPRIYSLARKVHPPRGRVTPPPRVTTGLYPWGLTTSAFKGRLTPTPLELAAADRLVQFSCARRNARAMASQKLRLYAAQSYRGQAAKWYRTRAVPEATLKYLSTHPNLATKVLNAEEVVEVTQHPVLECLNWVNKWFSQFTLIELSGIYLDLIGMNFWTFGRGYKGRPVEIWPLPAWAVYPQPDYVGTNVILNYVFAVGGNQCVLQPDEVLYFRALSTADPYVSSQSPLRATWDNAQIYDKQASYRESWLTNRVRPDTAIVPKEEIVDPSELIRTALMFYESRGQAAAGLPLMLPGNFDIKSLPYSSVDMGEVALAKDTVVSIARTFDIPAPLVDPGSFNRANYDAALLDYARNGILPRCRSFEDTLNSNFVCVYFDEDLFLAFDNPVPADDAKDRENNKTNFAMAALSPNELRAQQGLPPVANGDELFIPNSLTPLSRVLDQLDRRIITPNEGQPSRPDEFPSEAETPATQHGEPGERGDAENPDDDAEFAPGQDVESEGNAAGAKRWREGEDGVDPFGVSGRRSGADAGPRPEWVKLSDGRVVKYNHCHGPDGRFCSQPGGRGPVRFAPPRAKPGSGGTGAGASTSKPAASSHGGGRGGGGGGGASAATGESASKPAAEAAKPAKDLASAPAKDVAAFHDAMSGKWSKDLSAHESNAVNAYTSSLYGPINSLARSGKAPEGYDKKGLEQTQTHLDSALGKAKLAEPVTVYRGIGDVKSLGLSEANLKGAVIHDKACLSTSLTPGVAEKFAGKGGAVLKITAPAGAHGASMAGLGMKHNAKEKEVLFARNSKLTVTGHSRDKKGRLVIEATLSHG